MQCWLQCLPLAWSTACSGCTSPRLPPRHPILLQVPLPDICRTCGVAEGTIRQIYREIHPHLKRLIASAGGWATAADIDTLPPPPVELAKA